MISMEKIYILSILLCITEFCTATFFHHHHHHNRNYHWRRFHPRVHFDIPPPRRFPQGIPPSFINIHSRVPNARLRIFERNHPPPHVFPVGTVYPATGIRLPNPLNDLNTYDLPPLWTQSGPTFSNGAVRPNVDNIVPIIITRESTVTIPDRQTIPGTDGSTVDNDDEDNDQQTTTVPPLMVPPVQKKTCQEVGCGLGRECVYDNSWICTPDKPDIPCQCQQGCRMQFTFIPLGGSTIVDICGNICSCNSLFGGVNCTKISCEQPSNDPTIPGLVLEPLPTDVSDNGPLRGDFPIHKIGDQDNKDLSFPIQPFVPPIPFLTNNNFGQFPGLGANQDKNDDIKEQAFGTKQQFGTNTEVNNNLQQDAIVFPLAG